jgi:hypothetical protein
LSPSKFRLNHYKKNLTSRLLNHHSAQSLKLIIWEEGAKRAEVTYLIPVSKTKSQNLKPKRFNRLQSQSIWVEGVLWMIQVGSLKCQWASLSILLTMIKVIEILLSSRLPTLSTTSQASTFILLKTKIVIKASSIPSLTRNLIKTFSLSLVLLLRAAYIVILSSRLRTELLNT